MANELGELIRSKRKAMGLTQTELAEQLGTTQAAVSDWETGRATPSLIVDLTHFLDLTENEVMSALAARSTDDPVQRELMATTRVSPEVRNALLTLYREAARAHQQQNDET